MSPRPPFYFKELRDIGGSFWLFSGNHFSFLNGLAIAWLLVEEKRDCSYPLQFNDANMIREIEGKVVNRLRQVTASIKQDGENQVNIITNTAQRMASIEFGKASALRPELFGQFLESIAQEPTVKSALFSVLEAQ